MQRGKENGTHYQEKNQTIKTDSSMTEMMELS